MSALMASSPATVWGMLMGLGYTHELQRSTDTFVFLPPVAGGGTLKSRADAWQEEEEDDILGYNGKWQQAQRLQFQKQQKAKEEEESVKKAQQQEYRRLQAEEAERARLLRLTAAKATAVKEVTAEKIRNQCEALQAEQRDLEAENKARAMAEHQRQVRPWLWLLPP
jgi:hypothetical protein